MVRLLEEQNEIQEEIAPGKELEFLNDISNNTGATKDLLQIVSNDVSKNTFFIQALTSDNSKNLINLLSDNIAISGHLIDIKTEIQDGNTTNHDDLHDTSWNRPWLETVNEIFLMHQAPADSLGWKQ